MVRQNIFLKVLLGILCVFGTLSTVLVYTRYEVHVQRRAAIQGAKNQREEEHASHMRVMRLSMVLQRHLEDEVHDVAMLTTYRAWLMRAVGDYQMRVLEKSKNCSSALRDSVIAEGTRFDAEIERLLKLLWDDVVKEGRQAQKQLHNITHAIVAELNQDAKEQGEYERIMEDAGEDPGALGFHNHEVEYRGHLDGDESEHHHHHHHHNHDLPEHDPSDAEDEHTHTGSQVLDEHEGEHDGDPYHEPDDDDEEHLAGALERLLVDLQKAGSVLEGVSNHTIDEWMHLHSTAMNSLADEEQEVDLEKVNKKVLAAVAHVPGVPPFNASEGDTEIDYLQDLIRKARLAHHRDALVRALKAWQEGEERISTPLKLVENLIDEDILDPDVLYVHGEYEHYRYDDDDYHEGRHHQDGDHDTGHDAEDDRHTHDESAGANAKHHHHE